MPRPSPPPAPAHPVVLHAARLLDVETGTHHHARRNSGRRATASPKSAPSVKHPAGAEVIDLGDRTLLPGLIDAHVHLFLHPGAEDLQTVQESVPQRTIIAMLAARDDLMAGFTAERDMGTEGAGSADTAVRNAIDQGLHSRPAPAHQRQCHRYSRRPRRRHRLQPRAACSVQRHLCQQRRRTGRRDPPAVQGRRRLHQDL